MGKVDFNAPGSEPVFDCLGAIAISPWEFKEESGSGALRVDRVTSFEGSRTHVQILELSRNASLRVESSIKFERSSQPQRASETDLRRHGWRAVQGVHRARFDTDCQGVYSLRDKEPLRQKVGMLHNGGRSTIKQASMIVFHTNLVLLELGFWLRVRGMLLERS